MFDAGRAGACRGEIRTFLCCQADNVCLTVRLRFGELDHYISIGMEALRRKSFNITRNRKQEFVLLSALGKEGVYPGRWKEILPCRNRFVESQDIRNDIDPQSFNFDHCTSAPSSQYKSVTLCSQLLKSLDDQFFLILHLLLKLLKQSFLLQNQIRSTHRLVLS
jgi:hypothetical protein